MEKSRQYAHFSVTLRLLFKPVILSFLCCKILFFVWTRYLDDSGRDILHRIQKDVLSSMVQPFLTPRTMQLSHVLA